MKIKASEAKDQALDWAVAKCEAVPALHVVAKLGKVCVYGEVGGIDFPYQPSTDWAQGGPIIEREKLELTAYEETWHCFDYSGPTPLIAAMRCYVASKLGDEVEIPEELK
jgi:hypothetical protein